MQAIFFVVYISHFFTIYSSNLYRDFEATFGINKTFLAENLQLQIFLIYFYQNIRQHKNHNAHNTFKCMEGM